MTIQESIDKLIFIRDAYQHLDENGAEEFRIIGKGVNVTVEYSKSQYSDYVTALNIAISALQMRTPHKPKRVNHYEKMFCYKCPFCGARICYVDNKEMLIAGNRTFCCEHCGQALDWSKNNV